MGDCLKESEGRVEMQDQTLVRAKLPLVSVVVISYNHGHYLDTCLNAVFDQTYPYIECIVIDNASTDNSADIIARFHDRATADRTFEPVMSPVNSHLTKAMIAGAAKAKGSYIAFVDGDDYFLPTCIEAHIQAHLVSRVAVGVTSVDMYQSRDDDLVVGTGKTFSKFIMSGAGQATKFCRMENLDAFRSSGLSESCLIRESDLHLVDRSVTREWVWSPTSGLCFRREALELMFGYAPNILGGTDNYLVRGISSLTGSITIDLPLAVYRLHSSNMFTKHPALANLVSFDKGQLAVSDVEVSQEIIECFRRQAVQLAARIEYVDSYIEAIEMVSKVGPGLKHDEFVSCYTLEFIIENRETLVAAFGQDIYDRWKKRYSNYHQDRISFLPQRLIKYFKSIVTSPPKPQ